MDINTLSTNFTNFFRANGITEAVIIFESPDRKTNVLHIETTGIPSEVYEQVARGINDALKELDSATPSIADDKMTCRACDRSFPVNQMIIDIVPEVNGAAISSCPFCGSSNLSA
jgi:hypothetical protein